MNETETYWTITGRQFQESITHDFWKLTLKKQGDEENTVQRIWSSYQADINPNTSTPVLGQLVPQSWVDTYTDPI